MSRGDVPEPDDAHADAFSEALQWLVHGSANRLVRDADPGAYLDWIARHGASIGEGVLPPDMRGKAHAVDASRLMRLLGHMIYAAMPLPQHRFQPRRLPLPGRNDPCLCGSLRKFKQCCEPMMSAMPRLSDEMAIPAVLDAMGKKAWRDLPASRIALRLVVAAAATFRHERRPADAVALLEPWAAQPGPYPDDRADLLDLLGDLYADLGKPRKRKALAQAMIDRGAPQVQAKGWQRLALMATDAGKVDEARAAFTQAQRLAPDDPALALLDVTMLLGLGDAAQARERADFHARRLERMNADGRHDDLIAALRQLGEQGFAYFEHATLEHEPQLGRLDAWLAALPPPVLRLDLRHADAATLGELLPAKALDRALERWHEVFDAGSPTLVSLHAEGGDAWRGFGGWMGLLEAEPALGDSFDVIDGLLLALESHPSPASAAVARRLIERGLALWALLRARYARARCEWGVWTNRPALRILAQHVVGDDTPTAERSFDWLRHLVEVLNPHDNHGFRTRLAAVLLRRGLHADALALAERYPDDRDEMALAQVLALWHLGRRGEATSLFVDTLKGNRHLAKVMRSTVRPRPVETAFVGVGSLQEAQLAYRDQFDLWQAPELRAMIDGVVRRIGR
jgi:tetratricopeptide (TPR) repeat protein